jgi:hypothetical protein
MKVQVAGNPFENVVMFEVLEKIINCKSWPNFGDEFFVKKKRRKYV